MDDRIEVMRGILAQHLQTHKIMRKLVFILMLLISGYGMAQKVNLGGTVVDANGQPLPFVSVLVKGTQQGTVTNADGKFVIKADKKSALVFSFMGYTTNVFMEEEQNIKSFIGHESCLVLIFQNLLIS